MGADFIDTWDMRDRLKSLLGVLELDRRVHRVCRCLRKQECKRCPMQFLDDVLGEEQVCQRLCYGLALDVVAYAHGAVHPREAAETNEPDAP